MARKITSGGILPTRGRIPPVFVVFVFAFAFVGLVGFQILKERWTASADFKEKEFELENVRLELAEQAKLAYEREKERDTAQTRLLELEKASQSAHDTLLAKDSELRNMRTEYDRSVQEFSQLKKIVKQKEEEIVHIREQLQDFSFQKAKESAEQISNNHDNVMESGLENIQAEEHKPADEAGLDDRKGLQEAEEATKDGDVSALEKEMDERSKPKHNVLNEGETKDKPARDYIEESSKQGDLQEEEPDEQDTADLRDLDEKEIDSSQEEEPHEVSKLESEEQTGNHEDVAAHAQEADHGAE